MRSPLSKTLAIARSSIPNANCRNLGPGNPYTDGGYYRFAAKVFDEKIRVFQFPEEEDVIPLPLPNDGMTVP
jgi:hypothetical protein